MSPSENWLGMFNLTDEVTFETVSRNVATGLETKLSCPRQGRDFNWADATLEVYNVKSCAEFAGGAMHFANLSMWDEHGTGLAPRWLSTGPKVCGGKTTVDSDKITIEHSPRNL